MNMLVKLVNEWAAYEEQHPSVTIEEFCRFYLVKNQAGSPGEKSCPEDHAQLSKIMGFLANSFTIYFKAAMSKTALPFAEAFYFMNVLKQKGEMKKTELIQQLQWEYTTGMEGISKLLKQGLVSEHEDEKDRRARIIRLTTEGEKLLFEGYGFMGKLGQMMFGSMDADSVKLCIQLLSDVAETHYKTSSTYKNKDFNEIYDLVMNGIV